MKKFLKKYEFEIKFVILPILIGFILLIISMSLFINSVSKVIEGTKENGGLKKEIMEIWEGKPNEN